MPRKAREKSETGIYAVLISAADSRRLFLDDDDYEEFISRLYDKLDGRILAFALCESAVCLIASEDERGIGMTIKPLTTSYTRYYNTRYSVSGSLFTRRFKSMPLETPAQMAEALACVHRLCEDLGIEGFTGLYEDDTLVIPDAAMEFPDFGVLYNDAFRAENALIPFFAQIAGEGEKSSSKKSGSGKTASKTSKNRRGTEPKAPAAAQKPDQTTVAEKEPEKAPAAEKAPAKKKRNNMPSWLL